MIRLGRIGFKETEQLKYEQTYAYWKKVSAFKEGDRENPEESESQLQPVEQLINDYFSQDEDNLDKILFVLADFGKGKSVFLRHYAAKLAKDYLETHNGLFPVYFNLRDFKNYSSESKLGVIADYLETKYPLKIDDDYFKHRQYIFLVDSLDESGELTKVNTDEVIASVKKIQLLDKTLQRTNRIIITSRPFDEGLKTQLISHKPYVIKNSEDREIEYFVSVYGHPSQSPKSS
jgi:predicted NACHT family NTPase